VGAGRGGAGHERRSDHENRDAPMQLVHLCLPSPLSPPHMQCMCIVHRALVRVGVARGVRTAGHTHTHTRTYAHVHTHTHAYAHVHTQASPAVSGQQAYQALHTARATKKYPVRFHALYTGACVCDRVRACACVCACVCMGVGVCVRACAYEHCPLSGGQQRSEEVSTDLWALRAQMAASTTTTQSTGSTTCTRPTRGARTAQRCRRMSTRSRC
jgi:hypothetical protein